MLQGGVLKFHFPPFQGSSVSRAYLKKVKKKDMAYSLQTWFLN